MKNGHRPPFGTPPQITERAHAILPESDFHWMKARAARRLGGADLSAGLPLGGRHRRPPERGRQHHSDTWFAEHVSPTVFREPSGTACNGYALWREDVDLGRARCTSPPTGSRSSGPASSRSRGGSTPPRWRITRDRRPLPRVRTRAGRDVQPLHLAALVRRGRRMAEPVGTGGLRAVLRPRDGRLGDRIAFAVTMNEPNLARLLTWLGLPASCATLSGRRWWRRARPPASRYRLGNVMVPEEMDAMADGMTAGHRAARRPSRRPARLAGRAEPGDHRRPSSSAATPRARPQARRGLHALAGAGPRRRLRRRPELRAGPPTTAPARCPSPRAAPTTWAPPSSRSRSQVPSATRTRPRACRCW